MFTFPTFKPGKSGQASTSAPSAEKLNTPSRIRKKGGPREYTHTHMGVHKDIGYLKRGEFLQSNRMLF
jgi:hypothetical protein